MSWAAGQPWAEKMAACAQDSQWHAEGDVWTHTELVSAELERLDEWSTLDRTDQLILIFTGLLHDVAKPNTTQRDPLTGHVSSPKHAVKGQAIARQILRDLNCPLDTREQICRLVRFHGRPCFLLERELPEHEVIRISWAADNRLLYLFALADNRGRTATDGGRPEDTLHLWKLQAEELNCFDQPYAFPTDHARFLFLNERSDSPCYEPHEGFRCTVTMISGLPGSGKDTWLAKNRESVPVVSLDALRREMNVTPADNQGRVAQAAREQCRQFLRDRQSFCFNATNLQRETRGRWTSLFSDYSARIEQVYLEPTFERLLLQNRNRRAAVPESVVRRMAEKCDPPTWREGHSLQLIADIDS